MLPLFCSIWTHLLHSPLQAFSQLTQKTMLWQLGTVSSGYFPYTINEL